MTRDETKEILMVIQAVYPNYKPQDKTITVNAWYEMLKDYNVQQVKAALKTYILSDVSGFAPSIGQIIEKLQLFSEHDELNEIAAWQVVLKAIQNAIYHADEEYAKLPQIIQKVVVSPRQLREWSMMEDLDGRAMIVMQSNFMRTYRGVMIKEREQGKLSPDLAKLLQNTTEQMEDTQKTLTIKQERERSKQNAVPLQGKNLDAYNSLMQDLKGGIKQGIRKTLEKVAEISDDKRLEKQ